LDGSGRVDGWTDKGARDGASVCDGRMSSEEYKDAARGEAQPLLSFCLPTYNNAPELVATLNSIVPQVLAVSQSVEIVISDNASDDETQKVCGSFTSRHPFVKYFRNECNVGFDGNVLSVMEKASGRYCWLFGDDLLVPGALAEVCEVLEREAPVLVSLNYHFSIDGEIHERPAHAAAMAGVDSPFSVRGADAFIKARSIWFSFNSSNVVLRVPHLLAEAAAEPTRGFAHVYYIVKVCGRDGLCVILPLLGAVTQWTAERPANPPPLETFTVNLPAIFEELAHRGVISEKAARTTGKDVDRFIFPEFVPRFYVIKKALTSGTQRERRCYSAVWRRLSWAERVLIACTPTFVLNAMGQAQGAVRMKRALEADGDRLEDRLYWRYVTLPRWKRLLVRLVPARLFDESVRRRQSVESAVRGIRGKKRRV
jgi:glycosyltransferase involved in cell wall biosynthesis